MKIHVGQVTPWLLFKSAPASHVPRHRAGNRAATTGWQDPKDSQFSDHFDAFWLAAEELIDRTDPTESESDESDKAHEAVPSSIANLLDKPLKELEILINPNLLLPLHLICNDYFPGILPPPQFWQPRVWHMAQALCLGLAPWLAAETPILVDSGMIKHKDHAASSIVSSEFSVLLRL
ncbi:hypothetical protein C3L33_10784, partial [Rhododendron williamsianum]